jgi:5-methylcytosine-specific restriction endonuclease McrA
MEPTAFGARKTARDGLYPWCRACCVANTKAHQSGSEWQAKKARYDRERVARLRDKLSEQARMRYLRSREQRIAEVAAWRAANPDRRRIISMNYKARRRAQEAGGVTTGELRQGIESQRKVCFWCNTDCSGGHHIDHVEPLSRGGRHEIANLVVACPTCNLRKQAMLPERWIKQILEVA